MSGTKEIHFEDTVYEYLANSPLYMARLSSQFDIDLLAENVNQLIELIFDYQI